MDKADFAALNQSRLAAGEATLRQPTQRRGGQFAAIGCPHHRRPKLPEISGTQPGLSRAPGPTACGTVLPDWGRRE
jgi:hypothetical protein